MTTTPEGLSPTHGLFANCKACGFPIDSGGFCSLRCVCGDAEMVPCSCIKCRQAQRPSEETR